jgi:hypothetical protein
MWYAHIERTPPPGALQAERISAHGVAASIGPLGDAVNNYRRYEHHAQDGIGSPAWMLTAATVLVKNKW